MLCAARRAGPCAPRWSTDSATACQARAAGAVMLRLLYSPECVEGKFPEVRGGPLSSLCLSAPCASSTSPPPGWREVIGERSPPEDSLCPRQHSLASSSSRADQIPGTQPRRSGLALL